MHTNDLDQLIVDTVIKLGTATIGQLRIAQVLGDPMAPLPSYQETLRRVERLALEGELRIDKAAALEAQRKRSKGLDAPPPTKGKLRNSPTLIRAGEKARLRVFPRVDGEWKIEKNDNQIPRDGAPKRVRAGVRAPGFSKHQMHHNAVANYHLLLLCRDHQIDFFKHAISHYEIAAGRAVLGGKVLRPDHFGLFAKDTSGQEKQGQKGRSKKRPDGYVSGDGGATWAAIEVEPKYKNRARRREVARIDQTLAVNNRMHLTTVAKRFEVRHLIIVHAHPGSLLQMLASLREVGRREHLILDGYDPVSGEPYRFPAWPSHHFVNVDEHRLGLRGYHLDGDWHTWVGLDPADLEQARNYLAAVDELWPLKSGRRRADSVIPALLALPPTPSAAPEPPPASCDGAGARGEPQQPTPPTARRSLAGWLSRVREG